MENPGLGLNVLEDAFGGGLMGLFGLGLIIGGGPFGDRKLLTDILPTEEGRLLDKGEGSLTASLSKSGGGC